MQGERFRVPGGVVLVCSRGRKPAPRCSVCREVHATRLCDARKANGSGTCDAPLCASCARHVGPDEDLCPRHAARGPQQLELGAAHSSASPTHGVT